MALKKKLLSIEIGSERIKIAFAVNKGKSIVVNKQAVILTPKGSMLDGGIQDIEAVQKVIEAAFKENKIKEKSVVFTVSSTKIITREVDLPFTNDKGLKNIVDLNANEYFPVDLRNYIVDYKKIDEFKAEGNKLAKVRIIAIERAMVMPYIELANNLKLEIEAIDYAGHSFANLVEFEENQGTNLYIDLGGESTTVSIIAGKELKFNRELIMGTRNIGEKLSTKLGISYEEAEQIVRNQGLSVEASNENSDNIRETIEQIVSGVSRLVDFYVSRNNEPIEHIYLVGGGSKINSITDYIGRFFNIDCSIFDEIKKVKFNNKNITDIDKVAYYNVIGAILTDINLLPTEIKNKEAISKRRRLPILVLLLIIFSCGGIYYFMYMHLIELDNNIVKLESTISELSYIEDIKAEYNDKLVLEEFEKKLEDYSTRRSDLALSLIMELEDNMPKNSFIKSFSDSEEILTISFVTADEASMGSVLTYLKGMVDMDSEGNLIPMFSDVSLPAISKIGENKQVESVEATVTCLYFNLKEVNSNE